jgi:hypothetical protein
VVIFSFSQRFNASFTILATFVSRDIASFKSLWFTWISIVIFLHVPRKLWRMADLTCVKAEYVL